MKPGSTLLSVADARRIPLPDGSVHACICSPPYWGLRSYQAGPGEIGLEQTPDEYVAEIVAAFREVWRVLRKDGVAWLNLGDSYTSGGRSGHGTRIGYKQQTNRGMCGENDPNRPPQPFGLKPKDLVGIPWRCALALQADGWWLRSDIIWAKGLSFCPSYSGSVMPESCKDRPTQSYEHVFLLAKARRYFYDNEAVKEKSTMRPQNRATDGRGDKDGGYAAHRKAPGMTHPASRNLRSVWAINPAPSKLKHYAAFPPALVEPMVLASTSARGCCPECGAPWERMVEDRDTRHWTEKRSQGRKWNFGQQHGRNDGGGSFISDKHTLGWRPTCGHDAEPVPCVCLDPFGGTMTVGEVCLKHGRRFVGLDLKREYVQMGRERLSKPVQMAAALT